MAMYTAFFLLTILLVHLIPLSKTQCLLDIDQTDIQSASRDLLYGSTIFSLNLLRKLEVQDQPNPESDGIFFSPYSAWSTLMVTYMGAKGQTEAELKNALGVNWSDKKLVLAALNNLLNWNAYSSSSKPSYELANSVFFQKGIAVNKCIYETIGRVMAFLDFEGNPLHATNIINKWVKQKTNNKIQDLIPPGGIDSQTSMVIANAIYFKDRWLIPFDPRHTLRQRFRLQDNTNIDVNMMFVRDKFLYGNSEELGCTGLDMPYSGKELSMLILLPNDRQEGVSALANRLTPNNLQNFYEQMYSTKVEVSLPKFEIDNNIELSDVLSKMGIQTLFDSSQADLSGFTSIKDLSVTSVYHKAFIKVNEEGTEAAAATAVIIGTTSFYTRPKSFNADHPFIFMIRDNVANVILFAGTVKKPTAFGQ